MTGIGTLLDSSLGAGQHLLDLAGNMPGAGARTLGLDRLGSELDILLSTPSVLDRFRPGPKPQATPDGRDTTTPQDAYRARDDDDAPWAIPTRAHAGVETPWPDAADRSA